MSEEECKNIISKTNYYDILGIEKTADETQIKRAYRKLALKFHPDKNKCKSAEEAFKKINQAFCVLGDKDKKKNYDMFGTEEGLGMHGMEFNPFDIFDQFFQNFGGEGGFHGFPRGPGRTRVTFNNGAGSFTVFSSGFGDSFFNGGDDDVNPFEELFFGNTRPRNRRNNNANNNNNTNNNTNNRRNDMRKNLENNIRNINLCIQIIPIMCCLIFVIFPIISDLIFS